MYFHCEPHQSDILCIAWFWLNNQDILELLFDNKYDSSAKTSSKSELKSIPNRNPKLTSTLTKTALANRVKAGKQPRMLKDLAAAETTLSPQHAAIQLLDVSRR